MDARNFIHKARVADDRRADFPGEHWVVLGRAATGRGGLERLVKAVTGARR